MSNINRVVVFAGPSGIGKDTIVKEILARSKTSVKLTTATTRDPREGEIDGIDYYFMTKEKLLENIDLGSIPEHNEHAGKLYGTFLPDLEDKLATGKNVVAQVQLKGALFLKEKYNAVLIFIHAGSLDVLEQRIRSRGTLPEEEIKKRIEIAKRELEEEAGFFDYMVVNEQGKLEKAVTDIVEILKKEGMEV